MKRYQETTFDAVGFNFNIYDPLFVEGVEVTRSLFFNANSALFQKFEQEDARFGAYLSKQIRSDIRLRLEIKPVAAVMVGDSEPTECIQYNYNFHCKLNKNSSFIDNITELVNYRGELMQIVGDIKSTLMLKK